MSLQPILVFDFDGVIVDGLTEYWESSREACLHLFGQQQAIKRKLPLQVPHYFRLVRPWVKNGWEMVLLAAELLKEDSNLITSPISFTEGYKENCQLALQEWGMSSTQLQIALDEVRRNAIKANKQRWLASHSVFSGIVQKINQLSKEQIDFAVLTTKSEAFTSELLTHFNLYPKVLYGHESGPKPKLLLELSNNLPIRGFIEDRRATLETVINTPGLSSISCYLATWGYLKPNDTERLPNGIHLLRPEHLMSPLANWP